MTTKNIPPDGPSEGPSDTAPGTASGPESPAASDVELPPGYLMPDQPQEQGEMLRAKLLGETARAPWQELQRFFAQGVVLMAAPGVDMISVAMTLAEDNSKGFEEFLNGQQAGPVSDEQALEWIDKDATLWTVVVKPWIVVQEISSAG